MKQEIAQIKRWLAYRRRSVNRHGIHSPFVFDIIEKVLRVRAELNGAIDIEQLRTKLLRDESQIEYEDLGAGSSSGKSKVRTVKSLASSSLSSPAQCAIIYRLIQHLEIKNVLELGTSLGISSAYMKRAGADVITLEGAGPVAALAQENFKSLEMNIRLIKGDFKETLPETLNSISKVDLAFIDGNHRECPTLDYFNQVLEKIHDNSVLIFDDIHWSEEMETAWEQIKTNEKVTLSLDLFWCGIVFFRKGLSGEHFTIRY